MPAAFVNHAEERKQLRPGPEPLVHRVGVTALVGPQPLEQSRDRVEVGVDRIAGEQVAVFGVQDEDQPHEHGQQAGIDVVGVFAEHVGQQLALALVVGRLEAADQFVKGGQHLLGELRGDDVLVLAAVGQDGGQALLLGQREKPVGLKQHVQGREHRPAGDLGHRLHQEGHVAAGLAPRGVHQPQVCGAGEQPDGHFRFPQQPLEAGVGAGLPVPLVRWPRPRRSPRRGARTG